MRHRMTLLMAITTLALLGTSPLACGDDDPATSDSGTEDTWPDRDVAADSGSDATEEPQTDPVDDPEAEEVEDEPDIPETETDCHNQLDDDQDGDTDCDDEDCICEICNDLVDNDEDEAIDCQDTDCSDDPLCPEVCGNLTDDDADGDVDCDDSECAETRRCSEEPVDPDEYEFAPQLSYFYNLQYPPEGDECCFDFTGDSVPDNQLMAILGEIPEYDAQANMYASINKGDITLLVEWLEMPDDLDTGGPVQFNLYRGIPIDPPPPETLEAPLGPETNLWADGNGVFQVTRDGFDELGPAIRFEEATMTASHLSGGPHFIRLTVPIPAIGVDLNLTLYDAQIEADVELLDGQIATIPRELVLGEDTVTVGGGRLGGFVTADDMLAFFNEAATQCACATPDDAEGPLIAYGEQPAPDARSLSQCNWSPLQSGDSGYSCTSADSPLCPQLHSLCGLALAIPFLLDVDPNKNGIDEAISAGLYFDVIGASLSDPPVEPE